MESKLLYGILKSKEFYLQYVDATSNNKDNFLSDKGNILYTFCSGFYNRDKEAAQVDPEILLKQIEHKYPEHIDLFKVFVTTIINKDEEGVSLPNLAEVLTEHQLEKTKSDLIACLAGGITPLRGGVEKQKDLITKYLAILDKVTTSGSEVDSGKTNNNNVNPFTFKGAKSLTDMRTREGLIKIYPRAINSHLGGGVERATNILIFARPEVGKSILAITMACGFLRHGHKVLYIGNEDPEPTMRRRILANLTEIPYNDILTKWQEVDTIAEERGYGGLGFVHTPSGSLKEIRDLVKKYQPDCLIVDQMRHVQADSNESEVVRLEKVATGIRDIAIKHNLVAISVSQAGDRQPQRGHSEDRGGKLILNMSDIDSSRTGIPGAMDVIIGIGMNDTYEAQGYRMLSFPKNKINGNHSTVRVGVDKQTLRMVTL